MHSKMGCDCLKAGTRIIAASGENIPIERIKIGDILLAPITLRSTYVIGVWRGMETQGMIELEYGNGVKLVLTPNHPVYTQRGILQAVDIKIEDKVLDKDGEQVAITSVSILPDGEAVEVYNLGLGGRPSEECSHSYLAEGIIVGDFDMQNRS